VNTPRAIYLLSRDAVRRLDTLARERYAIPGIVLMENAARHAVDIALEELEGVDEPRVLVVAGPGNNGGDGLAMARHLHNAGAIVQVLLAAPHSAYSGDALANLKITLAMGLIPDTDAPPCTPCDLELAASGMNPDLIVDALFGTGLDRPLSGVMAGLVDAINTQADAGVRVLSVDLPSGLDAESGAPLPVAVRATTTVTFVALKPGLLTLEAQTFVGDLVVADIGAPRELVVELGTPVLPLPGDESVARTRRSGKRPRRGGRRA